jgi:outer membrane protein assembly factor BamB
LKKIVKQSNEKDIFGNPKAYNEISLTPPIVIDGKIIVISSNQKLIIISPENGRILEVKDYTEDIFGQPFVYGNKIYILKDNGRTILQL